jgi:FtsZ-binding cell division protein ZapB
MNRFLIFCFLIAAGFAVFFKLESDNRLKKLTNAENQNNTLQTEIKEYKNAIQKYNDAQERATETIEKVRTIVRTVKSDCDCWHTPVDDRVRDEIRKRRKHRNRK